VEYNLTPEQSLFRDTTRSFLEKEAPLTRVRELAVSPVGFDLAWWRRGAELGWASMLVSSAMGGDRISGNGVIDMAIVAEEMGRLVSPGPLVPVNVVAMALSEASNADDHAEVIEQLMAGTTIASWAVYEPDRGWDPAGIAVTATRDGDDYVLTGTKDRVDSGDQADYLLVTARLADSEAGGSGGRGDQGEWGAGALQASGQSPRAGTAGLTQFLVPVTAPGLTVTRSQSLDLVRRFATVRLEDVRISPAALVGAPGDGAAATARQLQTAVALQCAELTGAASRVFEFTVQWAFDRYSFGRPLASYQALKHRFADMRLWLEAAQATAGAAARAVGAGGAEAAELTSVAKAYIGERATDIIQDCVQLHGGIGVTWEHDIHLYLRRATVDRALWGTPSEHRRLLADVLNV
jgi:alkylation response protein AidB-like acyl-CoA dehydrogenase